MAEILSVHYACQLCNFNQKIYFLGCAHPICFECARERDSCSVCGEKIKHIYQLNYGITSPHDLQELYEKSLRVFGNIHIDIYNWLNRTEIEQRLINHIQGVFENNGYDFRKRDMTFPILILAADPTTIKNFNCCSTLLEDALALWDKTRLRFLERLFMYARNMARPNYGLRLIRNNSWKSRFRGINYVYDPSKPLVWKFLLKNKRDFNIYSRLGEIYNDNKVYFVSWSVLSKLFNIRIMTTDGNLKSSLGRFSEDAEAFLIHLNLIRCMKRQNFNLTLGLLDISFNTHMKIKKDFEYFVAARENMNMQTFTVKEIINVDAYPEYHHYTLWENPVVSSVAIHSLFWSSGKRIIEIKFKDRTKTKTIPLDRGVYTFYIGVRQVRFSKNGKWYKFSRD